MTKEFEGESGAARIIATLEQILAVQTQMLAELVRAQEQGKEQLEQALRFQQEAAERARTSLATQQKSAQLYRRVVITAALLVGAALVLGAYLTFRG
jgi:ethanolamine transporter EutH